MRPFAFALVVHALALYLRTVVVDEGSAIIAVAGMSLEVFHWPVGTVVISLPCYRIVLGIKAISSQPDIAFCLKLQVQCTKAIAKPLT